MIIDSYGRQIDSIITNTAMAAKLLGEVKNVAAYQTEEIKSQTHWLSEIASLVGQIDQTVAAEAAATRKVVERCCEAATNRHKPTSSEKIDPSEADEGREVMRTLIAKTGVFFEDINKSLNDGFKDINGGLNNLATALSECCPSGGRSIREPASATHVQSRDGGVMVNTRAPSNGGTSAYRPTVAEAANGSPKVVNNIVTEHRGGQRGGSDHGEILPDQFDHMSKGMILSQMALAKTGKVIGTMFNDLGFSIGDVFKGVVGDSITFIKNARMASFETRDWGEDTEDLAKQWVYFGSVVNRTGFDRAKFQEVFQKQMQRGQTLERRLVENNGKREIKLTKRLIKDQNHLTKASMQTAFIVGSNVDETAEMFSEWQRSLGLSNLELDQVSDNLKNIARTTGVSGDNLLAAAKAASNVTKEMRKTGALTATGMANVTQMSALFRKYGIEEFGDSLSNALSSWEGFRQAAPQLKALISQAGNFTGTFDKITAGSLLTSRKDTNEFLGGIEKVLMGQLSHMGLGITGLEQLPDLLQQLDIGIAKGFGNQADQLAKARDVRRLLANRGVGAGVLEGFAKMKEENKSPTEKIAELEKKKKDRADRNLPEAPGIQKAIDELRKTNDRERLNTFSSTLDKFATRDQSLERANAMLKHDGQDMMTMADIDKSIVSSIQNMRVEGRKKGVEDELIASLKEQGYDSFQSLQKAMLNTDNVVSADALSVFNSLQQQLEVATKAHSDPFIEAQLAMLKANEALANTATAALMKLNFAAVSALAAAAAATAAATAAMSTLAGYASQATAAAGGAAFGVGVSKAAAKIFGTGVAAAEAAGGATAAGGAASGVKGLLKGVKGVRGLGLLTALIDGGLRLWDAKNVEEDSTLTRDEKNRRHFDNAAGFGGGMAGATAGALIGSAFLPGLGTLIGGGVGYFGGSNLAEWLAPNFYDPMKSLFGSIVDGFGGITGWFSNKTDDLIAASPDEQMQKIQQDQIKAGTNLAHDDVLNPMREHWKSLKANHDVVQAGLDAIGKQSENHDATNFNTNAKAVLDNVLKQDTRGSGDQWSAAIHAIEEGVQKTGVALDAQTQKALDLLKGKSEKEFMQTQVRIDLQKQGMIIGTNTTKEEFDAKTAEVLSERLKTAGMNPDGTKNLETMAEKAIKPGSIYTHDIHSEKILGQMLMIMAGRSKAEDLDTLINSLIGDGESTLEPATALINANVPDRRGTIVPELTGAFATDQTKEAMIDALNGTMAITTLQAGLGEQTPLTPAGKRAAVTPGITPVFGAGSTALTSPVAATGRATFGQDTNNYQNTISDILRLFTPILSAANATAMGGAGGLGVGVGGTIGDGGLGVGGTAGGLNSISTSLQTVISELSQQSAQNTNVSEAGAFDCHCVKEAMMDATQLRESELRMMSPLQTLNQQVGGGFIPSISETGRRSMFSQESYNKSTTDESTRNQSQAFTGGESMSKFAKFVMETIGSELVKTAGTIDIFRAFARSVVQSFVSNNSDMANQVDRSLKENASKTFSGTVDDISRSLSDNTRDFETSALTSISDEAARSLSESLKASDVSESLRSAQSESILDKKASVFAQSMGLFANDQSREANLTANDVTNRILTLTAGAGNESVPGGGLGDARTSSAISRFDRLSNIFGKSSNVDYKNSINSSSTDRSLNSGAFYSEKDVESIRRIIDSSRSAEELLKTTGARDTSSESTTADLLRNVVNERNTVPGYGNPMSMGLFALDQPREAMMDADTVASMKMALDAQGAHGGQEAIGSKGSPANEALRSHLDETSRIQNIASAQNSGLFERSLSKEAISEADSYVNRTLETLRNHESSSDYGRSSNVSDLTTQSLSDVFGSVTDERNRDMIKGYSSMIPMGLFGHGQGRDAMMDADHVTNERLSLSGFHSDSMLESERLKSAIERRAMEESASKVANVLNTGLFSSDNVKETSRESLNTMSAAYTKDLNSAFMSARSARSQAGTRGDAGTSKALYITEDDDYPSLNTYLSNAATVSAAPSKGQVSSNLITMEDAEQYVSRAMQADKPTGPSVLMPGIDSMVDLISEAAKREERIIKILEQIRDQKSRPNLMVDQGGASSKEHKRSGIRNWSKDVVKGMWAEAQHGSFAEQTNATGDVRGGA